MRLRLIGRVQIVCLGVEFAGQRVNLLNIRRNLVFEPQFTDLCFALLFDPRDRLVGETELFGSAEELRRQFLLAQFHLELREAMELLQKPRIDLESSCATCAVPPFWKNSIQSEEAPVGRFPDVVERIFDLFWGLVDAARADVEHPDPFLQRFGKRPADRHHFADAFHLGADAPVGAL